MYSNTLTEWLDDGVSLRLILLEQNVKFFCPTNALQVTFLPIQDDVYEMHQLVIQIVLARRVAC